MLRRLEELGLVTRTQDRCDLRAKLVRLTEEGQRRLRRAIREIMVWGHFVLAFESAFRFPSGDSFLIVDELYWTLYDLSRHFGDGATLSYPKCHPDD
jgi:DNA-binding MarR family transcriptional regulator